MFLLRSLSRYNHEPRHEDSRNSHTDWTKGWKDVWFRGCEPWWTSLQQEDTRHRIQCMYVHIRPLAASAGATTKSSHTHCRNHERRKQRNVSMCCCMRVLSFLNEFCATWNEFNAHTHTHTLNPSWRGESLTTVASPAPRWRPQQATKVK